MDAHNTASFLIGFSFGYVSTTLLMAALTTFLAWWLAALVALAISCGIACTEHYARAVDVAATHAVAGVRSATSWLRAKYAQVRA